MRGVDDVTDCPHAWYSLTPVGRCYHCAKLALAQRHALSLAERAWIGWLEEHARPASGWRSAGSIAFADLAELLEHFDEIDGATRIVVTNATARRLGGEG
jgi:hypothetical protein